LRSFHGLSVQAIYCAVIDSKKEKSHKLTQERLRPIL